MALAILAGAMAVIGEMVRGGMRNSQHARDLTHAQLICESVVAQVVAGAIPVTATSNVPFEDDPQWVYSITTETAAQPGMLIVHATVALAEPSKLRPVQFTISRWMIDPSLTSGL